VFGNDLGGGVYNGKYQPEKTNALTSPPIDTRGFTKVRLQYRRWLTVEDGFFDQARIFANEVEVWSNLATDAQGTTHHQDREWRFHDVDLTEALRGDRVSVTYQLKTDASFDLGGWTIDDFCVVGVDETPRCGDGLLGADETCDDGNLDDEDGCSAACTLEAAPRCGDGKVDPGEACDDGNASDTDGCTSACSPGRVPACGDGVVDEGEACDDGLLDGTACAPGCVAVSSPGATPPAAAPPTAEAEEGCGCTSTRPRPLGGLALALLLGGLLRLRRRVS
jgi:MYXO-CTERM domain-containing protein